MNVPPMSLIMNVSAPVAIMTNYPNPAFDQTTFKVRVSDYSNVSIKIYDINGKMIAMPLNENKDGGTFEINVDLAEFKTGNYFATLTSNDKVVQTIKFVVSK